MTPSADWPLWAVALQDSSFGLAIRHSLWLYPAGNVLHVLGVALLVGSIVALDCRLLGFARKIVTVEAASRLLTPFAVAGIALLVPGGLILFTADAGPLAANSFLQAKLALAALGVANAALFRLWWGTRLARWDRDRPDLGRAQAALSIAIWLSVPALGRLIAYL
jgi:hypothetical protein